MPSSDSDPSRETTQGSMPPWALPATGGISISSAELLGSPYVLYFYPKDMTPGCTTEACDFRDNIARLSASGVRLFGVSCDPLPRHEAFVAKYDLPFPLLSDVDHAVAERLGVWQEKSNYGKKYMGLVRTTLLVGKDGTIVRRWENVRVKGHVDEVLAAVEAIC